MKRGIGMGYAIILSAYLTVSITGRHLTYGIPLLVHARCAIQQGIAIACGHDGVLRAIDMVRCLSSSAYVASVSLLACRLLGIWSRCPIK